MVWSFLLDNFKFLVLLKNCATCNGYFLKFWVSVSLAALKLGRYLKLGSKLVRFAVNEVQTASVTQHFAILFRASIKPDSRKLPFTSLLSHSSLISRIVRSAWSPWAFKPLHQQTRPLPLPFFFTCFRQGHRSHRNSIQLLTFILTRPQYWDFEARILVKKSTAFNSFEGCDSFIVPELTHLLGTDFDQLKLSDRRLSLDFCVLGDSPELAVTLWLSVLTTSRTDSPIDRLMPEELETDWPEADWLALCESNSDNDRLIGRQRS